MGIFKIYWILYIRPRNLIVLGSKVYFVFLCVYRNKISIVHNSSSKFVFAHCCWILRQIWQQFYLKWNLIWICPGGTIIVVYDVFWLCVMSGTHPLLQNMCVIWVFFEIKMIKYEKLLFNLRKYYQVFIWIFYVFSWNFYHSIVVSI